VARNDRNFKFLEMLQHLDIMSGYFREVMVGSGKYIKEERKVRTLDSARDTVTEDAIIVHIRDDKTY
jgi:hypothetical protein